MVVANRTNIFILFAQQVSMKVSFHKPLSFQSDAGQSKCKSVWWKYTCLSLANRLPKMGSAKQNPWFQKHLQPFFAWMNVFNRRSEKKCCYEHTVWCNSSLSRKNVFKDRFCRSISLLSSTKRYPQVPNAYKWACVEQVWRKSRML